MKISNLRFILSLALVILISCNKDIENVMLEGFVYKGDTPIPNFQFFIKNYYYEGGDYDSFMPAEYYNIITNEKGYFFIDLNRSAYLQIDTVREGYSNLYRDKYVYSKKVKIDIQIGND